MEDSYYFNEKKRVLACLLETDVVEYKDRDENPEDVESYVIFQDLSENRVHFQELDDFNKEFLGFTMDDIPMLQEWYGMDNLSFARLRKMIEELLLTKL